MPEQVTVKILPQYVETTDKVFNSQRLHSIQAAMLNYDALSEVIIITAPTGTGKSFSFPLPVIETNRRGGFSRMRCVIVSPTNALIEDMQREYAKQFPELKTEVLNRSKLDSINAHGLKRWDEILNIIRDNDVIITNPDLLNWAVFGGYSFTKKQPQISRLFDKIDYIVFDEYHLYDEEQIANIISWMTLKQTLLPGKPMKFVFASATPEPALADLLKKYQFNVQELSEIITNQPSPTARQIHGEITIIFRKIDQTNGESIPDIAVENYLLENQRQVKDYVSHGDKILVMVDRMVSLRMMRLHVQESFADFSIAEESGYFTKAGRKEDITNANLILATNKVEVGVNLNVKVCFMPAGRYFSNFIQRLGRVARGNMDGVVVVFVEKIEQLKKAFLGSDSISYYNIIERCRSVEMLNDRRFYTERIPRYLGAFFFIIQERTLKDYAAKQVFKKNLRLEEYEGESRLMFHTLRIINNNIFQNLRNANATSRGYSWEFKCIREWWVKFLETFQYFRSSGSSLKFFDLDLDQGDQVQEYSMEWILANRFITGERIINGERYLEVSGFRKEKQELQFVVESFPFGRLNEEHSYLSQKERWDIHSAFLNRTKLCIKEWQNRIQDDFSKAVVELLNEIIKLSMIFSPKRLLIKDIREYSNFIDK